MHARVNRFRASANGDSGTDVEELREGLLRQLGEIDGFRGLIALDEDREGASIAITLWEDEAAMVASRSAADAMRRRAAEETGDRIVDVTEYEVTLLELRR